MAGEPDFFSFGRTAMVVAAAGQLLIPMLLKQPPTTFLVVTCALLGVVVWLALRQLVSRKGYPPAWALFALIGVAGCIVVMALPDRATAAGGFPVGPPRGRGRGR